MTPVRTILVVVTVSCPVLLTGQQASFTTGGGVAQVDQFTTGPIGTLAADGRAAFGPIAVQFVGSTINHRNLGTASRVRGDLRFAQAGDGWRVGVGPVLEYGSGINEAWTHAWSGAVLVGRELGPLDLEISAGEGVARPGNQRVSFGRRGARATLDIGPVQLGGDVDLTIVRDSVLRDDVFFDPEAPGTTGSLFRSRERQVIDAAMLLAVALDNVQLRATIGRRSGDDITSQTWWRIEGALPVADAASVVVSTARTPADAVLGLRGARVTTVGLKVALPDEAVRAANAVPARVEVTRESGQMVRVVFILPGGQQARVMGEMTGWQPVQLEAIGRGRFVGWFLAGSGTYRVNVALDNGPWIAPPGMPRVEDGFGGMVGLLDL